MQNNEGIALYIPREDRIKLLKAEAGTIVITSLGDFMGVHRNGTCEGCAFKSSPCPANDGCMKEMWNNGTRGRKFININTTVEEL